ncbi:hypothetical protein E2562_033280 [Oryza meyeriana var. granulata]|uniref:Uncharacterized protein n=1 Tax=Oryza meyeriana var. granulata TaxID=110450 RepID=A0A6G1CW38_9ORYZ|nr:hypothetical protein E2562_033280 [Oryza meyeriana var. granulata]
MAVEDRARAVAACGDAHHLVVDGMPASSRRLSSSRSTSPWQPFVFLDLLHLFLERSIYITFVSIPQSRAATTRPTSIYGCAVGPTSIRVDDATVNCVVPPLTRIPSVIPTSIRVTGVIRDYSWHFKVTTHSHMCYSAGLVIRIWRPEASGDGGTGGGVEGGKAV